MPSLSVSEWVRSTASARDEQFYSRDFEEGNAERERGSKGLCALSRLGRARISGVYRVYRGLAWLASRFR